MEEIIDTLKKVFACALICGILYAFLFFFQTEIRAIFLEVQQFIFGGVK